MYVRNPCVTILDLFTMALGSSEVSLTPFDVINNEYPSNPSYFDVIAITGTYVLLHNLTTGAKYSSYDTDPWITTLKAFTKRVVEQESVFVFAVCFGHQIVTEALGGKVIKNSRGWEAGLHEITLNQSILSFEGRESLRINQMHQDFVSKAPAGFNVFASTPICENHGMISGDKRVVSIQGHPEFSRDFMAGLIKYEF
jgi:GMP synthase-like glutamine amidotransferase